jgi:hypothetical protein
MRMLEMADAGRVATRLGIGAEKIIDFFSRLLLTVFAVILHNTFHGAHRRRSDARWRRAKQRSIHVSKRRLIPSRECPGDWSCGLSGRSWQGAISMAKKKKKAAKKVAKKKKGHG